MKRLSILAARVLMTLLFLSPLCADEGSTPVQMDWTWYSRIKSGPVTATITSGEMVMQAAYDKNGRITEFWPFGLEDNTSERMSYDAAGRLVSHSYGFYDEKKTSWTESSRSLFTYDNQGRLILVKNADESFESQFKVDDRGRSVLIDEFGDPEMLNVSTTVYNSSYQLVERSYAFKDARGKVAPLWKVEHTYDAAGNRIKTIIFQAADKDEGTAEVNLSLTYTHVTDATGNRTAIQVKKSPVAAENLFDEWTMDDVKIVYSKPSAASTVTVTTTTPTTPPASSAAYKVGAKVQVLWESSWYDATILAREGARYKISYDGYDSSWDEWVTKDRLR